MAHLLDLVDLLIGDIFQGNMFTDVSTYRATLPSQPQQIPADAFSHIPISRGQFYKDVPTPPSVLDQRTALESNMPPPPGAYSPPGTQGPSDQTVRRLSRGEIYGPDGVQPPNVPKQRLNLESDVTPPPGAYSPPGTQGPSDQTIRQLSRGEIYGASNVPPQSPSQQRTNLQSDTPPPPGAYSPPGTQGPSDQTIRQLARGTIYGTRDVPPTPGGGQRTSLEGNSPPPPGVYQGGQTPTSTAKGPEDKTIHQLDRPEIYASDGQPARTLGPSSAIMSLADYHEQQTRPFSPTQAAERRLGPSLDSTIPQTPDEAGPSQIIGRGLNQSTTVNEFANVPLRPLNFENESDAPPRRDLVAAHHPQHLGWNASGLEPSAQRRGFIADNLYSDSDTPFEGNFQSVFRGPIPQPLNYFNIVATGHWLRNIASELFLGSVDGGFEGGGSPAGGGSAESVAKGITFIASQFLLASMNPWNPNVGSAGNGIWNPLSILGAVPVLGSAGFTNITLAAAFGDDYQPRVQGLDDAGGSRLLLARQGAYAEFSPVHALSKFPPQSPISAPGFVGDTVGPLPGQTLDVQQRGLPVTPANIDAATGGPGERGIQSLGIHTNLYTEARPYNPENARFPLQVATLASLDGQDPGADIGL